MKEPQLNSQVADLAPADPALTAYDEEHASLASRRYGPHGRLWRPGPAVSNDRPMPQRRLRLAGDRMLSMQNKSKSTAGCYPQGA
jgi:hypothetical protein